MKNKIFVVFFIILLLCGCNKEEIIPEVSNMPNDSVDLLNQNIELKIEEVFPLKIFIEDKTSTKEKKLTYEITNPIGMVYNDYFVATDIGETTVKISDGTETVEVKFVITK